MYYFLIILVFVQTCNAEYFSASKSNIFTITENAVSDSYFGYSLQLQRERIIVGAPKANSTKNGISSQNGVVYSCSTNTKKCGEIFLQPSESRLNSIGLGSALDAEESENGFVVTCAPAWSDTANNGTKGMCFSFKNNSLINELYPLKNLPLTQDKLYYSQFGQVGFSVHLIKNQDQSLILGSPGVYSWTGTLAQYSSLDKKEDSTIADPKRADRKIETFSYFGYSISSGRFNASNPAQIFYVSGAPRNNDLHGSVNVFEPFKNEPFKNRYMFSGTQFGEYFGASVTVGNLNADDLDDIVIGAPTHSNENQDDVGCIYVFHAVGNKNMLEFQKPVKIEGEKRASKFGFALSYLGDVNRDGYGDIAVGAPYYDNNKGAVYIYLGSKNGIDTKYKQKILASTIDNNLRGFGCSLSRGLDVDHNTNNDLAVGAYISGQVALLISRPIIQIQTNMSLDPGSQLNINTTNLVVKYCWTYETDTRLPVYIISFIFSIMNTNKVTFEDTSYKWTQNINMQGHQESCNTFKISIIDQIFSDVILDMDYKIISTSSEEKFNPLEEKHSPPFILRVPFNKGCSSSKCQPNLKLTVLPSVSETNWIIGTSQNIQLQILLENMADPSYQNKLEIRVIPERLKFSALPNYCEQSDNTTICNIKYPILKNEKKKIVFELDATKLEIDDTKMIINATIISDMDTDPTDNTNFIEIPLKSDVNFKIIPKSQPEEINNLTGIQILSHQYNIENVGVTQVKYLKLNFLIPYKVEEAEFLNVTVTGCSQSNFSEEFTSVSNGLVLDFLTDTDSSLFINCTTMKADNVKCKMLECEVMNSVSIFSINITMMINSGVLGQLDHEGPIILSTSLEPDSKFISTYSHIWTKLVDIKQQTANITMFIIIGILVSLLLVFILIFILYKCGFFTKRKLPNKSEHENLLNAELISNNQHD